jgi:hypothetical protein
MKLMSKVALLIAVFGVAFNVQASTEAELVAAQRAVTSVPAPEMPAKAAQVVKAAKKKDRSTVASSVIRAIAAKNRTSVLVSVSSIIKANPETASAVAQTATEILPDQALRIARIASIAAPQETQAIRNSVAEVAPAAAAKQLTLAANSTPSSQSAPAPTSGTTPSVAPATQGSVPNVVAAPITVTKAGNATRSSAHTTTYTGAPQIVNRPVNNTNRVIINEDNGTIKLGNQFTQEDVPDDTIQEDETEIEYGQRD